MHPSDLPTPHVNYPPKGYPEESVADTYSRKPFLAEYESRRNAFLDFCSRNPAPATNKGFLYELARLATGRGPIDWGPIEDALRYVDARIDCADFILLGIVRLLLQFGQRGAVPAEIIERAKKTVLGFKYWPDEPGRDSMCTWTENHQIIFSVCEYLAGMLFPDEVFTNSGATGREKMKKARPRLLRWMELRFRTGFNEWLSNVYYDEDIAALTVLADFCDDALLARGARCALDLLFLDMSLNSFRGTFGCTHGRSYEREKKSGLKESTADTGKLAFGMGIFGVEDNMSAAHLALSRYRMPKVIYEIARDPAEMLNRQRIGIRIAEAPRWRLGFDNLDDGMTLLSFEAYVHPKTFPLFVKMLDAYDWWDNDFFAPFKKMSRPIRWQQRLGLLGAVAWLLRKDIARNMREEARTATFRTPDYMLSAALDYKKGWGGDQHHIWQATLSEEAVCFTTHPGRPARSERTPNYWTGSGFLPRVGMYKNLLVAVYKIPRIPTLYVPNKYNFTHAYFPRNKFDEVAERNGWLFGRKGRGYLALHCRNGYRWQTEGPDRDAEVISDGRANIWLCEMGREQTHGGFNDFCDSVASARLDFSRLNVRYRSPSCGELEFGWRGGLRVNGASVPLRHEMRYDNPYAKIEFDPSVIEVRKDEEWLRLELDGFGRSFSSVI